MTQSINKISRPVRRTLKKILQKQQDGNYRRRANAILLLNEGYNVSETAKLVKASRNSIRDWRIRYETHGEVGLVPEEPGRPAETVNDKVCTILIELIQKESSDFGYLRSRWTSEMLAEQVYEQIGQPIHSSTVRRLLPILGIVWNRARPTLYIQDPLKTLKMKRINNVKIGKSYDSGQENVMAMNVIEIKSILGDSLGTRDNLENGVDIVRFRNFKVNTTNGQGSQIDVEINVRNKTGSASYAFIQALPKFGPIQLYPLVGVGLAMANNVNEHPLWGEANSPSGYSIPGSYGLIEMYGKMTITDKIWFNYNPI